MGIFKKRNTPVSNSADSTLHWFLTSDAYDMLCVGDYVRLTDNAEFQTGLNVIADLVSNMSIKLMANTEKGDKRIYNELSRKLDIEPNRYMTRKKLIKFITYNLLVDGNQITLPEHDREGNLLSLNPIKSENVSFNDYGLSYDILINGVKFECDEVLHFTLNAKSDSTFVGRGYQVELKDILSNLKQAGATKKAFMGSKYMPPVIVSVDSNNKSLSTKEGREKIIDSYIDTDQGKPWVIPSTSMDVKQVKPLTLKDLAINETVQIDKRTVAAVLRIPAFLLGVGEYNEDEYNNFINTTILSIAKTLEQEMTKKLIYSPKMYIQFNVRSLLQYSIQTLASVGKDLRAIGVIDGNEVRDWIGMSPREGLDELVMLENYIPSDKLGDQKKLGDETNGD